MLGYYSSYIRIALIVLTLIAPTKEFEQVLPPSYQQRYNPISLVVSASSYNKQLNHYVISLHS